MTPIGDIIFALVWFGALVFGIRLMSNGWSLMTNAKREWSDHYEDLPKDMVDEIKNSTHPEMQDIQPGEELVVMKITNPEEKSVDKDRFKLDSPVLHGEDPLHKSLQDRINELKDESKSDEDDDDDDGGAGVVLSR